MDIFAITSAFALGTVTFFSPCVFPMLPAYLAFYLGLEEKKEIAYKKVVKRGLINGLIATLAFLVMFVPIGLLMSYFSSYLSSYQSYIDPIIGAILIILGIAFLLDVNMSLHFNIKSAKNKIFSFSMIYGLAAIGCYFPLFLNTVLTSLRSEGPFDAALVFVAYSLGMGAMMIFINLLIAGAKHAAVTKLREAIPIIKKIGGALLIGIGVYFIYHYFVVWVV